MDPQWVSHISIHHGPSPVLVALSVLLLGGWSVVKPSAAARPTPDRCGVWA
jgi:hypothetical protein